MGASWVTAYSKMRLRNSGGSLARGECCRAGVSSDMLAGVGDGRESGGVWFGKEKEVPGHVLRKCNACIIHLPV